MHGYCWVCGFGKVVDCVIDTIITKPNESNECAWNSKCTRMCKIGRGCAFSVLACGRIWDII